jgi:hypothetical protein
MIAINRPDMSGHLQTLTLTDHRLQTTTVRSSSNDARFPGDMAQRRAH